MGSKPITKGITEKKGLLLSVGVVFRTQPENAKGIIEGLSQDAEIIYLKQSYGKLWVVEAHEDCEVWGGQHD